MTEDRRRPTAEQTRADSRQSPLDRRMLLILILVVVVAAIGGGRLSAQQAELRKATKATAAAQHQLALAQTKLLEVEQQSEANCLAINTANTKFNENLDASIGFTAGSMVLTPEEKVRRLKVLSTFHLPVVRCPAV